MTVEATSPLPRGVASEGSRRVHNVPSQEVREKLRRVRAFLRERKCGALILRRPDNFAWFSGGGDSETMHAPGQASALLAFTADTIYLVAHAADGPRLLNEALHGVDVEPMFVRCQEESCEKRARHIVKGLKALSDVPMRGAVDAAADVASLHYPLMPAEIDRLRRLGSRVEEILASIAQQIRPGMRERDIEAMCLWEYARADLKCRSLLIGSDARISRYPRAAPSSRKVERLVLFRPTVRMRGLHARITRMVWFGDHVPKDHAARHEAACRIEAATIASCAPGRTVASVLEIRKQVYADTGFREEWRDHFCGGLTGYTCGEAISGHGTNTEVGSNLAFNWIARVGGFAAEELNLTGPRGLEVATVRDHWPARRYEYGGCLIPMPEILKR